VLQRKGKLEDMDEAEKQISDSILILEKRNGGRRMFGMKRGGRGGGKSAV